MRAALAAAAVVAAAAAAAAAAAQVASAAALAHGSTLTRCVGRRGEGGSATRQPGSRRGRGSRLAGGGRHFAHSPSYSPCACVPAGCAVQVLLEVGPLAVPLPIRADGPGFVEWLYLDAGMRITRGNKGSTFIHVREQQQQLLLQ